MKTKVALLLGCLLLSSCAAVRGRVVAENVPFPVSLTPYLYDAELNLLSVGDGLEACGAFSTEESFLGAFYGFAPMWWTWDASDFLREVVERHGGEGVIDLTATVEESSAAFALYAYLTQTTPLAPIWVTVRLSGTVVRSSGTTLVRRAERK